MRNRQFAAVVALSGFAAFAHAGTVASDSFNSGVDGWTVVNGATGPFFNASGGASGGYIDGIDNTTQKFWAFQAPTSFLGNLSSAYGGTLSYSLEVSNVTLGNQSVPDVKISGNGITLAIDAGIKPGLTWTSFSVAIRPGAWHLGDLSGALATAADMQTALSNVSQLLIRGDYAPRTRGAVTGLDSVLITTSAVPELETWAMWLGGLLAVGSLSRRRGPSSRIR